MFSKSELKTWVSQCLVNIVLKSKEKKIAFFGRRTTLKETKMPLQVYPTNFREFMFLKFRLNGFHFGIGKSLFTIVASLA